MKSKSSLTAVMERLSKAADHMAVEFAKANQAVIRQNRTWPGFEGRVTRRRNRTVVVGANRNIEDLGNLADSQKLVKLAPGKYRLSWDGQGITPVVAVYYGAKLRNGGRIPGRRWVKVAIEETNFAEVIREGYNQ